MYVGGRETMPPANNAVKIANALGITVEYLVTGQDNSKESPVSPESRKLLSLYSILDERDKQTVMDMIESMAERYANSGKKEKSSSRTG